MMRWLFVLGLLAALSGRAPAQTGDPSGIWVTDGGRSQISVYPCGPNYCGSVVKLAEPYDASGRLQRDSNNPDPALRNRPLIGLRILRDMAPVDGGAKWQGIIYNPEDGDTYDGSIQVRGEKLEVEGCMLIVLCQSQFWLRAPQAF